MNNAKQELDVLILSAQFGLIHSATPVAYYERRMTTQRARFLQAQVARQLPRVFNKLSFHQNTGAETFLCMSELYLVVSQKRC